MEMSRRSSGVRMADECQTLSYPRSMRERDSELVVAIADAVCDADLRVVRIAVRPVGVGDDDRARWHRPGDVEARAGVAGGEHGLDDLVVDAFLMQVDHI